MTREIKEKALLALGVDIATKKYSAPIGLDLEITRTAKKRGIGTNIIRQPSSDMPNVYVVTPFHYHD